MKLIDASFNGTLVKEVLSVRKTSVEYSAIDQNDLTAHSIKDGDDNDDSQMLLKRRTNICYCVLRLARHGELFKFLEYTEKFSD